MQGTDICTIGDPWIQIPGNQVTTLENHMISAGVIPSGSHFDRREVSGSTLSSVIGTYTKKNREGDAGELHRPIVVGYSGSARIRSRQSA